MKATTNLFIILLFISASSVVFAESNKDRDTSYLSNPWSNYQIDIGTLITEISSRAKIGSGSLGLAVEVDFEKALGLETSSFVFATDGVARFGKRNKSFILAGYYGLNRTATKELSTEIEFFGQVYKAGTIITTSSKLSIISASYGYTFYQTKQFDFGASLGFFVMPISLAIGATFINGESIGAKSTDFIAPLPMIGLHTSFALSPRIFLRQNINLFYIKIENLKGNLTNINLSLDYRINKYFGAGLGFNSFNMLFEARSESSFAQLEGSFSYKLSGISVYGTIYL